MMSVRVIRVKTHPISGQPNVGMGGYRVDAGDFVVVGAGAGVDISL